MMMMVMIMMTNDDDGFSDIFRGFQVSEIAEAVEEVKQFVRPTREKVLDQFNFSTWIIDIFNAVILFGSEFFSEIPKARPGLVSRKKTHPEGGR